LGYLDDPCEKFSPEAIALPFVRPGENEIFYKRDGLIEVPLRGNAGKWCALVRASKG
jgi:hypothetical protein